MSARIHQLQPQKEAAPPQQLLQPHARHIEVWVAEGAALHTMTFDSVGFLVFTPELAQQCEVIGADFLYLNPAVIAAMNVESLQLQAAPQPVTETATESEAESSSDPPTESEAS
jgi:hypothetical protein